MLQMEYRHKIEFSMPEIETFLAKFKITCTNTLWIALDISVFEQTFKWKEKKNSCVYKSSCMQGLYTV